MHNWDSIPLGTLSGPSEELCKISLRIVLCVGRGAGGEGGAGALICWISPLSSWGVLLGMLYLPLLTSWLCEHLWPPENIGGRRAGAAVIGTWGGTSRCAELPTTAVLGREVSRRDVTQNTRIIGSKSQHGKGMLTVEAMASTGRRTWWGLRGNTSGFSLEMAGWVKALVP